MSKIGEGILYTGFTITQKRGKHCNATDTSTISSLTHTWCGKILDQLYLWRMILINLIVCFRFNSSLKTIVLFLTKITEKEHLLLQHLSGFSYVFPLKSANMQNYSYNLTS